MDLLKHFKELSELTIELTLLQSLGVWCERSSLKAITFITCCISYLIKKKASSLL